MNETNPQLSKKEQYEIDHEARVAAKKHTSSKHSIPGWVWGAAVVLLVLAGLGKLVISGSSSSSNFNPLVLNQGDYIKGEATASATLVEFADFQCPACAAYSSVVDELVKENPDKIKLVFRNFPLKEIHANAIVASTAAEAAGKQGKFWEMYSLLYAKQGEWENQKDPKPLFDQYAGQLGMNVEQFNTDMKNKDIIDKVNRDRDSAIGMGLNSTPTFFLNGKKLPNPRSIADFKQEVLQSL